MSHQQIFLNLPVKDLARSRAFFDKLGYKFNPQFSNDDTACMVVGEHIIVMLLVERVFATFTKKAIVDAKSSTEVLIALAHEARSDVDRVVEQAKVAGAMEPRSAQDHGFMYGRAFEDPDGHIWEHFWMDPAHLAK